LLKFGLMNRGCISITLLLALALTVSTSAEVIHLKNGRAIYADHVRENGTRLQYDVGDDSYAISMASVDHIESGGFAASHSNGGGSTTPTDDIAFKPVLQLANEVELTAKLIHDGRVDPEILAGLEKQDSMAAATGYFLAGRHEFEHGDLRKARSYFESCLRFDSQNVSALNYLAASALRTGSNQEALTFAERAARMTPDSPDTLAVLGYAQLATEHNQDAVRSWKKSLEIRPDANLKKLLDKAERESRVETEFSQKESSHFTMRFEGKQTKEELRQQILTTLETQYDDLVREIGIAPRNSIAVVLYTEQAFFDVTQSPSWASAMYDGKLRIPISGVQTVTPELARVLKHELAHAFVTQITGGRCPQWLNEGVAQYVEPRSLASHGRRLVATFHSQQQIPYNVLESGFLNLSPAQAMLAYDESLAAVNYISETYGSGDVQRILERVGSGSSLEAALRQTIHAGYGDLEQEVARYLAAKYGN
jgi:tetratricopeptide (TPR) repeat protein